MKQITVMAADSPFTAVIERLCYLRVIATPTAFVLATEIGDWHRFIRRTIASYLGLGAPRQPAVTASRECVPARVEP